MHRGTLEDYRSFNSCIRLLRRNYKDEECDIHQNYFYRNHSPDEKISNIREEKNRSSGSNQRKIEFNLETHLGKRGAARRSVRNRKFSGPDFLVVSMERRNLPAGNDGIAMRTAGIGVLPPDINFNQRHRRRWPTSTAVRRESGIQSRSRRRRRSRILCPG